MVCDAFIGRQKSLNLCVRSFYVCVFCQEFVNDTDYTGIKPPKQNHISNLVGVCKHITIICFGVRNLKTYVCIWNTVCVQCMDAKQNESTSINCVATIFIVCSCVRVSMCVHCYLTVQMIASFSLWIPISIS